MSTYAITTTKWTAEEVLSVIEQGHALVLSSEAEQKINQCHAYLQESIARSTKPIYGINTGFGALCNTEIQGEHLALLQHNLVVSHACGVGDFLSPELSKLMLLLKIKALSLGHSGVAPQTVHRLIAFYNHNLIPVIPSQGSLGASGDLAPLAHLSLPLIGKGWFWENGKQVAAEALLEKHQLQPLTLGAKEGLALLNGTQFMAAFATYLITSAKQLLEKAIVAACVSIEAFEGKSEPFHPALHRIRNHQGQMKVAEAVRCILADSEIFHADKKHVQDPYSFRCIPQVLGAIYDQLVNINTVVEHEINAVTDNPTIFPDEDLILSGGNFHGEPLALALDQLCILLTEMGSLSERRIYKLISGTRSLPPFLVANPGLNSGFMIPQYVAASMVSQNKQLSMPSSVDTIDSSNGQEDHVSMGANAAIKALQVFKNTEQIISIELLNAMQALDFRSFQSAKLIQALKMDYRHQVKFVENDCELKPLIDSSLSFLRSYSPPTLLFV